VERLTIQGDLTFEGFRLTAEGVAAYGHVDAAERLLPGKRRGRCHGAQAGTAARPPRPACGLPV